MLDSYTVYKSSGVEWLGDIPEEWSTVPLRYLAVIETGSRDTVEAIEDGVYPFIVRSPRPLAINSYSYDCEAILTPGDGDVGNVFHHLNGKFDVHQRVYVLHSFRGVVPRYLFHYFASQFIKVVDYGGAKTTVASLRRPMFTSFPVAIPPIDEQYAIAAFLDRETAEIDAFIADQEQLIGLLTERRSATISRAVTKGLDPSAQMRNSGFSWIGDIPDSWQIRRIWTMYSREKNVGFPDEQMLSVFRDYGVILKSSRDNINKTAENRNIYQLVEPGWLVANRMKAWQGSVGISPYRGVVSGHYICFRPNHAENNAFLNLLFRSLPYAAGYQTISRGVRIGQAEIDNDEYRLLPVLLPPLDEQLSIVSYLERETAEIDSAIADARESIELSKERRSALIAAAVTGKINVRHAQGALK